MVFHFNNKVRKEEEGSSVTAALQLHFFISLLSLLDICDHFSNAMRYGFVQKEGGVVCLLFDEIQ